VKQQMGETSPAEVVSQLSAVHQSRGADGTPREYLACVNTFTKVLTMKHEQLKEQKKFLQVGGLSHTHSMLVPLPPLIPSTQIKYLLETSIWVTLSHHYHCDEVAAGVQACAAWWDVGAASHDPVTCRAQGGLDKLAEASTTVDVLSRDADRQRTLLRTKQAEAEEALTRITASMEQAADRRKEVEVLRARLAAEEVELNQRRGVPWVPATAQHSAAQNSTARSWGLPLLRIPSAAQRAGSTGRC
jgi:hypothetical protein